MLAMDYCLPMGGHHPPSSQQSSQIKYAASTMSSETVSESCGSRHNRVRTVRLVRPANGTLPPPNLTCKHGPNLGFSLRGGREHGTGFFVSSVETGSEAHRQGLRVGDQIVRINGFTIEDAVHKEVLQLISNHTHLTLKVRSVGMIPIKDRKNDSLSWQIITNDNSSLRSSPQLHEKIHDVRINIMVAPRSKLGCGICKGPEWKQGIFIQFTKEGGIAREAGLRPGDQILICNNVDFSDIQFNEAVNLMKTSRQLDLVVRKSAGSELFPGESSGYNSSASSVTGDQSPSWSDSKRLSIVKEESLDLEDRLSQLDQRFRKMSGGSKWDAIEWDEIQQEEKPFFKPTIINLSENGTTIKNNGDEEEFYETRNFDNQKMSDNIPAPPMMETKTVVVEVHRSDEDKPKVEKPLQNVHNVLTKSASVSSFSSVASRSSTASSSLSSAICMEIQRRNQKNPTSPEEQEQKPSIDEQIQMKKIMKNVSQDKQFQHTKLMDEFKKAHRKMFRTVSEPGAQQNAGAGDANSLKEAIDRLANKETNNKPTETSDKSATIFQKPNEMKIPPPPPPLPTGELDGSPVIKNHNLTEKMSPLKPKVKGKAPPVPIKYSTLSYTQNITNNGEENSYKNVTYQRNNNNNNLPDYYCPTPDYDTLSIASSCTSTSTFRPGHINNDSVEMESLESFRLDGNSEVPKPPNTYFKKSLSGQLSNGSTANNSVNGTLRRSRPVSVTIGEYPTMRRNHVGKLDFLGSDEVDSNGGKFSKRPVSAQFSSELAETLKRSNLKKRTESVENLLMAKEQISPQQNGSVRISLTKNLAKSTNDLFNNNDYEKINLSKSVSNHNRVTININANNNERKVESPNGILKNTVNGNQSVVSSVHKTLSAQKSITFGEMPTLIKGKPAQVT
ncbi:unnamed protein product [Brassicogethes aeneus]|uniref:PDZ domain-containing protein n=1 Tax=Brassicogethes aeneus TaxID=1431903 RepID=A0A9P0BE15_BRAAE|nr:unnamed protein product [Brassicogethes aeneus]